MVLNQSIIMDAKKRPNLEENAFQQLRHLLL